MSKLNDTDKTYGMKINVQKQRQWVVRWDGGGVVSITVEEQGIKQIKSSKCLGSVITEDGRSHIYEVIS